MSWVRLSSIRIAAFENHQSCSFTSVAFWVFKHQNRKNSFVRTDYPNNPVSGEIKVSVSLLILAVF